MASAEQQLRSLVNLLATRRQTFMEKMAKGLDKEENYREYVGRCKELADTIGKIKEQVKSITGGEDDDATTRHA